MQKITYRLIWHDLKAVERYARSKNLVYRLYFWGRYIGLPLIFAGMPLWSVFQNWDSDDLTLQMWRVAPFSVGLVFWAAILAFSRWSLYEKAKHAGFLDRDLQVGLSEEGLWYKDSTGEGTILWSAIKEVCDYRNHVFFVMPVEITVRAIPKRSFLTFEEASDFHQEALRLWEKHRNG
jgi:hypothetical protein